MNLKRKLGDFHVTLNITKTNNTASKFIDLMPLDNAGEVESYCQALGYAMDNNKIKNIAITGPYGSGKSSLIKTFESKHAYKFLNISLASFDEKNTQHNQPDSDDKKNLLIERSILQQMLYGASANKIPYSRFKRIATPEHPLSKSFILFSWLILASFFWFYGAEIIDKTPTNKLFSWDTTLLSLWISFSLSIPVVLASDIYKSTFGLSLRKISLTNAEIETGDIAENSILNKHLDEIIYFFQSTKYDVVVFEDLDRFGSPEIFVKLREINRLINENDETTGNIKFLYALKDDMFANNDRAKFFDMIIPILPIINSYNSLDKIKSRVEACSISDQINAQFLREVSLYLNDLRLIHNIFNEYIVYSDKLKSKNLNTTKLLAMMIYKNVYPNDFEKLHHGKGALCRISQRRLDLIQSKKTRLDHLISETTQNILDSEHEVEVSIENLMKTFVGHLVLLFPGQVILHIKIDGEQFSLPQLLDWMTYERITEKSQIIVTSQSPYGHAQASPISIQDVNEALNKKSDFIQRKMNIENKARERREELEQKITKLEHEKIEASHIPLYKLLQENDPSSIDAIINGDCLSDPNLFMYLIKNGYLDETYHLYTSNFHEGRMTLNDRDFLLTIRDFKAPDPLQIIDTPEEVCENMRSDDFAHIHVLNVILMNFLLKDKKSNSIKLKSALNYIANNFNNCDQFFSAYWVSGTHIPELTIKLSEQWPAYATSCLNSINAAHHIALIISHVSAEKISPKMNKDNALTNYLSEHGISVFSSDKFSLNNYQPIKLLNVKFKDVSLLNEKKELIDFVHQHNLYEINPNNILYLMAKYSKEPNKESHSTKNLSSLSSLGCEQIKEYISINLPEYIDNVFLKLPNNTKENEESINSLLDSSLLNDELKKQILTKQDIIFDSFSNLRCEWREQIITENKITPSWKNIADYLTSAEANADLATQKIQENDWLNKLKNSSLKSEINDENQMDATSTFILENDKIEIAAYKILIVGLPYIWNDFPDVSIDKQIALAMAKKVKLNNDSFSSSSNKTNLRSVLIENNLSEYLSNQEKYPIDDETRALLLESDISKENKIKFCHDMTLQNIKPDKNILKLMEAILSPDGVDCSKIDQGVMKKIIILSEDNSNQIQLLNKYIETWRTRDLTVILEKLPEPYCGIPTDGGIVILNKNKNNLKLVNLLESNNIISGFSDTGKNIQIDAHPIADHIK